MNSMSTMCSTTGAQKAGLVEMTVSAITVGNALWWFEPNSGLDNPPVKLWRTARNKWLRAQGMGGIIKNGKQSKSFPSWWGSDSEFWFADSIDEQVFADKWKS